MDMDDIESIIWARLSGDLETFMDMDDIESIIGARLAGDLENSFHYTLHIISENYNFVPTGVRFGPHWFLIVLGRAGIKVVFFCDGLPFGTSPRDVYGQVCYR